uniref:Pecanex-like protein n=1 Tax=Steinernema glaseri TaxID=37863 RepID=A0A1I8A4D1_9BILA
MMGSDTEARNIFVLGLCVLFVWMAVIICFSSPQLFRDLVRRYCCRCVKNGNEEQHNAIKIKSARERVRSASRSVLTTSLVSEPSAILLQQVLSPSYHVGGSLSLRNEAIPEDSEVTGIQTTAVECRSSLDCKEAQKVPPV